MRVFSVTYSLLPDGFCYHLSETPARTPAGTSTRSRFLLLVAFCALISGAVLAQGRHEAGAVAVVANRDLPVANLSLYEMRRVFLGETRYWKSNMPVVLIVPAAGTRERDVLLHTVYHMTEAQYKQYWIGRILRGDAISAPKTAESASMARELVASVPGCITVMNPSDVNAHSNVRVLTIDGKSPGDQGYALTTP